MDTPEAKPSLFYRIIRVPPDGTDSARRKQLLNILLLGVFGLAIALLVMGGIRMAINGSSMERKDMVIFFGMGGGLVIGTASIYALNRTLRGSTASILFLIFLVILFNFADSPDQLANGRSMLLFTIPIIMAGILLRPLLSFVFAAIASLDIVILAVVTHAPPNFPAIIVFFLLALLSWLSARSLERALRDLRFANANLDRLVRARTRELSGALTRERIEAGRSKAILKSIADGVIVFDVSGKAIEVNPAIVRLLEKPEQEIRGATIDELTRSKTMDARNRGILAGLLTNPGQQVTSYRINWMKKSLSVSSSQVNDTAGERIGTVAVFRDFTREAEVEQMKNTFLAVVTHELRTPLNAILGYAEMLRESIYGPINEKQTRAAVRIMSNSQHLLGIVNDLLDQAQMETGKLIIQQAPFRPIELVENIHEVMDKLALDKGLKLKGACAADLPEWIMGDKARLQQILINLLNNSIKFTRQGAIDFRLLRQDRKNWTMEVTDTGIGIPQAELERIFDVFHQVDGKASREHDGLGLGLSIVKQLANLMGGEVRAVSELGKGSTFTVTLPLVTPRKMLAK